MKLPNWFVLIVSSFTTFGGALTGIYIAAFNGILEMEGFQDTFSDLYSNDQMMNSTDIITTGEYINDSYYIANTTSGNTCSSGNGASSDTIIGLMVSISNIGSAIGCLLAGWLADRFSRKYALLIYGLITAGGTALMAASFHAWMVVIGRAISGIGVGAIYMLMPVYISEISPKESRGMLASLIGPAFALGTIMMLCLNIGFSKFFIGWRVSLIFQVLLSLFYSVGMIWMPHTPRWLVLKQREKEALLVLSRINDNSKKETFVDTYLELEELKALNNKSTSTNYCALFKEIMKYKSRLLVVLIIFFFEAASGNSLLYFSSTFFCQVGILPFVSALIAGLTIFVASILMCLFIDSFGRKMLLLGSSFTSTILTITTGTLILLNGSSNKAVSYAILCLICLYLLSYSSAWVVVPWIISSEVFPTNIRGSTVALSTGLYWLFSSSGNLLTPLILGSVFQVHGYFYLLAGFSMSAFLFILIVLPETKGVSLEKMDELFSQGICQRINIFQSMRPTNSFHEVYSESKKSLDNKI